MPAELPAPPEEPPRWLDEDEAAAWLGLVHLMIELPAELDRALRERAGIGHAYYMVLAMLSEQPDESLRMSELAALTGLSPSRLSHAVSSLASRGWLTRTPDPDDGRGQRAVLTPDGRRTLVALAPGHVADVRRLVFDRLEPRDVADLRRIAARLDTRRDWLAR